MNSHRCRGRPQDGTVLLSIVVVAAVATILAGALLAVVTKNTLAESDGESSTKLEYVTVAALNQAYAEITSKEDSTGNGLGAIGIDTPVDFLDTQGRKIAEWRTIVEEEAETYVIRAIAATPSFANPRFTRTTTGIIEAVPALFLRPLPAAIGISGFAPSPEWRNTSGSTVKINGGPNNPALMAANQDSFDALLSSLANRIDQGMMNADSLQGGDMSTHTFGDGATLDLPITLDTDDFVSSAMLNDYRVTLRAAVTDLAQYASRTVDSDIGSTPVTWGTPENPEVTIIDAQGKKGIFDGADITGAGVLIIHHTVKPDDLKLNWTGDVYVLGHTDTINHYGDLFYTRGDTDITINGSFVMLADGNTEASFESKDSAQMNVNGVFLSLAEATSHEAEIETEGNSQLNINGIVALYGSRIELEAGGRNTEYNINGSLTMGIADDNARSDEFTFDMLGRVAINWDDQLVANGIASMMKMELSLGVRDDPNLASYAFQMLGGGSGGATGDEAVSYVDDLIATNGVNGDYGVSVDDLAFKAGIATQGDSQPWWVTGGALPDSGSDNDNNNSGLGDGTNPGQGSGTSNSPNQGTDNPNNSGHDFGSSGSLSNAGGSSDSDSSSSSSGKKKKKKRKKRKKK